MPDVPDLSKLNGESKTEPQPPQVYRTAFLVLVDAQGNIQVSSEVGENTTVEHPATHDEIWSACQLIIKDIQVQQTAGLVQQGLLQMGSIMQQQSVDQQIRNRINLR